MFAFPALTMFFLFTFFPLAQISDTNERRKGGAMTNDANSKTGKMDSRIGLEYIVENSDYVNKLGLALDTNNVTVKKQVFELLSALCAYSSNGYKRTIETLEHYKVILPTLAYPKTENLTHNTHIDYFFPVSFLSFHAQIGTSENFQNIKGERYRLNIVVVELDKTTAVEYQIALLAFINCIIISAATLQDRIRIRNEFIGE